MHLEEETKMVAQFSARQHNVLFEHPKSDSPLIILQSAEKFNGEKTGTQLSYIPKVCPSHHLENQVKFGFQTCFL